VRRGTFVIAILGLLSAVACSKSGGGQAQADTIDLADHAWSRGDTARARALLTEVLREAPRSFPARYRLAFFRMETDPAGAIRDFEEVARLDPKHPGPVFYSGLARLRMSDFTGAERDLRRGYALAQARRGYSLEDTSETARRGLGALNAGQFVRAAEAFTQALETDPENPVLWYLKARSLATAGALEPAGEAVTRALEKRPRFAAARALHAELLLASQQPEPAREELRLALEEDPNLAAAHYHMGLLHLAESEFRTAALDLWQAVLVDPTVSAPHQLLGQTFMDMDQRSEGMIYYQHFEWITGFLQRNLGRPPDRR
jgi:tetratricopeptide (TPR) repeat protein